MDLHKDVVKQVMEAAKAQIVKTIADYKKHYLINTVSNILQKDMKDDLWEKAGQQISALFHRSHYFFNVERDDFKEEIQKFVDLLFGNYQYFPTQDEYGMTLAYQAKFRSNFPGGKQVGACILTDNGEVIAAGEVRAPSPSANTDLKGQEAVAHGFNKVKERLKSYCDYLKNLNKSKMVDDEKIKGIIKYLDDSLEYHPCTHAEIAAILDAAKLGTSVKGAVLYSTTFPCHLCAKDIISAGIKKLVYMEAYPKSKNRELYTNKIAFNESGEQEGMVPFNYFVGVSPKRYSYVYHEDNKSCNGHLPHYLRYLDNAVYKSREKDIASYLKDNNDSEYIKLIIKFE